jgi:hypothetical protein
MSGIFARNLLNRMSQNSVIELVSILEKQQQTKYLSITTIRLLLNFIQWTNKFSGKHLSHFQKGTTAYFWTSSRSWEITRPSRWPWPDKKYSYFMYFRQRTIGTRNDESSRNRFRTSVSATKRDAATLSGIRGNGWTRGKNICPYFWETRMRTDWVLQ